MKTVLHTIWHAVRHLPLILALSVLMPHVILLHLFAALCAGERRAPQAR